MSRLFCGFGTALVLVAAVAPSPAAAATPEEIGAAIVKGQNFLKKQPVNQNELGFSSMVGLALLETGVRFDDPALKAIHAHVRERCITVTQTYHIAAALLFLDRYGEPNDGPLVQMLGVRLLFGQTSRGGWTYACIETVSGDDEKFLRSRLGATKSEPGKMHPDVVQYQRTLFSRQRVTGDSDDNSNTQFGVLALWVARRHAVPVDSALDAVVERFLRTQNPTTGGWPYDPSMSPDGSPSMTCAGLLALATGYVRRDERLQKSGEVAKKPEPAPGDPPMPKDPFFSPLNKPVPKTAPPKPPSDRLDAAASRAMAHLGAVLNRSVQLGRGKLFHDSVTLGHGHADFYFFWSLERVGVVYGLDKIGGVDWYAAGAETIVRLQKPDGSWPESGGGDHDIATSFAILFLAKSNVVRDLSQKVQKTEVELRGGAGPGDPKASVGDPKEPMAKSGANPAEVKPKLVLPIPTENEAGRRALDLVQAAPLDWTKKLHALRDAKGFDNTMALAIAIPRLEGERHTEAREALAERLTRMTPDTLRAMMKSEDAELRRGAVLAAAMKDDKSHIPDLIDRLLDDEEFVVRAARAGLKSLSDGKDFGPVPGASRLDRDAAVKGWRQWWAGAKK